MQKQQIISQRVLIISDNYILVSDIKNTKPNFPQQTRIICIQVQQYRYPHFSFQSTGTIKRNKLIPISTFHSRHPHCTSQHEVQSAAFEGCSSDLR